MGSISLRDVSIVAQEPLFRNLTLTIAGRDRLGLVAGNGGGKTTLLRCLAGLAEPTGGEIVRSRGARIALVEQDVPENLVDLSLHEAVRRALPPAERDGQEWRVDMVLDEFETPEDFRGRALGALSGGWQRLALIARAWITEPDLLLLDEPTNHLDLEKLLWLETWIRSLAVPVAVASHDRDFLDACTTRTLFLRPDASVAFAHSYRRARALLEEHDAAAQAQQERTWREAKRLRQSAGELKNIGVNSGSDAAQKKSAQMAKRAEALEQSLTALHRDRPGDIRLGNRGTHARVLLTLEDAAVTKPDGGRLFTVKKLEVARGDRVVLLGRNGVGKSRLVHRIHRALLSPDGEPGIRASASVVLGFLDQDMSLLPQKSTALDFILSRFRLGDQRSRSLLAGAGFPADRQGLPIARLSPGQRARLGLLAVRLSEPNVYLMDEPTNHVDIAGREQLEAEILGAEATCILVSHDRSFVKAVGTRFLLIEGGRMTELDEPEAFYRTLAA
ncbi:MAG TPA: ABC-F family ATP-binding cassette domain-containing protein [Microvirga sp.]|jgi:ATPase subunit of ABC transporter with duplicated ATPase domains|nr:ABC-F family ATP-binding cassette domain-containing protein [Microvirga sp.]